MDFGLENLLVTALAASITAFLGYIVGRAKSFTEAKHKAYSELLPSLIKVAYAGERSDEPGFIRALALLWLYASKKVAKEVDHAVWILHHPSEGDKKKEFQKSIAEMRADIQFWPWQKLDPEDVQHIYSAIGEPRLSSTK